MRPVERCGHCRFRRHRIHLPGPVPGPTRSGQTSVRARGRQPVRCLTPPGRQSSVCAHGRQHWRLGAGWHAGSPGARESPVCTARQRPANARRPKVLGQVPSTPQIQKGPWQSLTFRVRNRECRNMQLQLRTTGQACWVQGQRVRITARTLPCIFTLFTGRIMG